MLFLALSKQRGSALHKGTVQHLRDRAKRERDEGVPINSKRGTRLTVVKDLHLAWTRCAWAEIQNATIIAGFEKAGIIEAYKTALTPYDDVDYFLAF